MQAAQNAVYRPLVISLLWDIALNTTIPAACYFLAKRFLSPSEMTGLIGATLFPMLKSGYELARRRELDPVAVLVLLGVLASILALLVGGDSSLLLIRESFFTGAFGVACLLSLALPRPLMFFFGRYFMAGKDPQKRNAFNEKWQHPVVRRAHRLITAVWGLVYLGEFAIRVVLVYTLPAPIVLTVTPFLIGVGTISTIAWTFHYASRVRRISDPKE